MNEIMKEFEIKRTSRKDYELLVKENNNTFDFMSFSSRYLKNDCLALYEVLCKFMKEIREFCPLNPLLN